MKPLSREGIPAAPCKAGWPVPQLETVMETDLITTGTLDVPVRVQTTLVAHQIVAYLEQYDKTLNQAVLDEMVEAFRRKVVKQLMSTRNTRKGHESCTVYSGACARKSRYQYDGVTGEPVKARAVMKWLMGDTVELDVIGVAQLAGVDLSMNNADLFITGRDGVKVPVHPDGLVCGWESSSLVNTETGTTILRRGLRGRYNVEVKSCDTRTFDAWDKQGGPDDTWGYLTQASVEIAAWREAGYEVNSTCFVAVSTGSRQGSVNEWIIPYDQKLVDAWHDRRALARGLDLPPRPFEAVPELEFVRGKSLDPAVAFAHGVPTERQDKNGKIIGYDVPTGRMILPTYCGYCAYKGPCWPGAVLDADDGKPVWTVSSRMD